jgi:dihydrofolate reductase
MSRAPAVVFEINLSLDGFVAGVGGAPGRPLGEGEALRSWAEDPAATAGMPRPATEARVLVCGRRTYESSLPEWGAHGPQPPKPVLVMAHTAPPHAPSDGVYRFVAGGVDAILAVAARVLGEGDVRIMGGAATGRTFLAASVVNEVVIHLVPVLLGAGVPMWDRDDPVRAELVAVEFKQAPGVTHLHYRVVGT